MSDSMTPEEEQAARDAQTQADLDAYGTCPICDQVLRRTEVGTAEGVTDILTCENGHAYTPEVTPIEWPP